MKPYAKTILTAGVTAAVTFSVTSAFFVLNMDKYTSNKKTDALMNKLEAVNTYVDKNYLYDDVDFNAADEAAVKAYVEAFGEPYTRYYDSDEFETYIDAVEDSYVGIGVVVSADTEKDKITVISTLVDSPAYEAGLKPGDYIISAEGKEFAAKDMEECVKTIKGGPAGTKVSIQVERNSEKLDFEIERKEISENSVTSKILGSGIGYIAISSFNTNTDNSELTTYTEFKDTVERLQNDGMKKMIIDLRDNPGGVLEVVCEIADYILPEGMITYTETKDGKRTEYKSDANEIDIPIVVLINGSSASASEILTGALKDYDRAEVVGTTSFGKGIVQTVFPFWDGSGMSMTIAKYYTPKGQCIHGIGIEPDYKVELPDKYADSYASEVPESEDTQLKKAIEILKGK